MLVVYRLLKIIFLRSIIVTVIIFGIVLSNSCKSHFKIRQALNLSFPHFLSNNVSKCLLTVLAQDINTTLLLVLTLILLCPL